MPSDIKAWIPFHDGYEMGWWLELPGCGLLCRRQPLPVFLRHFSMTSRPETGSMFLSILVSLYILGQGTYKMQTGMFRWESLAIRSAVKLTGPFVMPFFLSYLLLHLVVALPLNVCHL